MLNILKLLYCYKVGHYGKNQNAHLGGRGDHSKVGFIVVRTKIYEPQKIRS